MFCNFMKRIIPSAFDKIYEKVIKLFTTSKEWHMWVCWFLIMERGIVVSRSFTFSHFFPIAFSFKCERCWRYSMEVWKDDYSSDNWTFITFYRVQFRDNTQNFETIHLQYVCRQSEVSIKWNKKVAATIFNGWFCKLQTASWNVYGTIQLVCDSLR